MKKNKSLIIILLIVVIGVVGLTLAYFANTTNVSNEFKSREYGTTVTEEFISPDNWLTGSTEPKKLTVTNSGNVDEAVRVSYTETWTSANSSTEGDLELSQGNNRAAIINFNENGDWSPVTENNKTYYYYNYKLAPQETTSTLLDSVTFNSAITNESNCTTVTNNGTKTITCDSTGNGYDGATYKLVFTVETVQYDKYGDAWGMSASIANTSKPLIVKGLKINSADKTYETGDKHEMFSFSHPETEQMKATTDYRYIGDVPNNYVKFNCDNDGTNCEIWRIIGVFEVDDGTGNYETRIKLVRGSAFATTMAWNANNDNDWINATLNTFLNNDYYNGSGNAAIYGLKETSRNMICDSKYYLGGTDFEYNRSTEVMYSGERGKKVYNKNGASRSTSWVGKIGLMYPSDYGYTFSNNVDDVCFNDLNGCYEHEIFIDSSGSEENVYPSNSWIYNSNILDEENNPS